MTVEKLSRNDVPSAIALYRSEVERGTWTVEQAEVVLMLQDDPNELMKAIAVVNREPGFLDKLQVSLDAAEST